MNDSSHRPGATSGRAGHAEQVGIRRLRGELATLVRRAGRGERVVITVAGRPVAQLGPVAPQGAEVTLADLVARGELEPPRRDDRPAPTLTVPTWAGVRLDTLVREVRGR
ncbi:MAG: type II toxin-antitoxin system prevent-host-death family antitoxin [Microthrixaceae bacterium]